VNEARSPGYALLDKLSLCSNLLLLNIYIHSILQSGGSKAKRDLPPKER